MRRNAALILEIIDHSREHLTAEEIYLRLKAQGAKAVLATVYNNLADLYTQGLIRKVSVEGCPDRYDRMERHDHLVCRRCGKLSDIMLEDLTQKLEQSVVFSFWEKYDETHTVVRFATSWGTRMEDVEQLADVL